MSALALNRRPTRNPSGCCASCSTWVESLEMDHIVPLFAEGPHDISNIQWLCPPCHDKKTAAEWYLRPNKGPFCKEGAKALRETGWEPRAGKLHSVETKDAMRETHKQFVINNPEERQRLQLIGKAGAAARWGNKGE